MHKATLTASYALPMDETLGDLTIGATFTHTSRAINDGAVPRFNEGIAVGVTPSNNLLNLNLDWRAVGGSQVDLSLFATNVTKERFNIASGGGWNSAGLAEIILNQPRFYGVRLRWNFGN